MEDNNHDFSFPSKKELETRLKKLETDAMAQQVEAERKEKEKHLDESRKNLRDACDELEVSICKYVQTRLNDDRDVRSAQNGYFTFSTLNIIQDEEAMDAMKSHGCSIHFMLYGNNFITQQTMFSDAFERAGYTSAVLQREAKKGTYKKEIKPMPVFHNISEMLAIHGYKIEDTTFARCRRHNEPMDKCAECMERANKCVEIYDSFRNNGKLANADNHRGRSSVQQREAQDNYRQIVRNPNALFFRVSWNKEDEEAN